MIILAMDTSAKVSSVSIVSEDKILGEFNLDMSFTHSQTIMPMCESLLNCCQLKLADVDAFAVSSGPGSFTGLRIGISAIKAMAYALNKPCIEVSTLDALAYNQLDFEGVVCATMDARCNQVYNANYLIKGQKVEKLTEDRALLLNELLTELKDIEQSIILVGDGANLCYNSYKDELANLKLASKNQRLQRASCVAMVAHEKAISGEYTSASDLIPQYLRLPQAQRELNMKLARKK